MQFGGKHHHANVPRRDGPEEQTPFSGRKKPGEGSPNSNKERKDGDKCGVQVASKVAWREYGFGMKEKWYGMEVRS